MIAVNYDLFLQIIYCLWWLGGLVCIGGAVLEEDMKKKLTLIGQAIVILIIVGICLVV